MRRLVTVAILMPIVLAGLSGCVLVAPFLPTVKPAPTENVRPPADGPSGWVTLPQCPGGPNDDWVFVEGFPSDEFDSAGVKPDCGETWIEDDGDSFVDVTAFALTVDQLDALGAQLEQSGYQNLFADFDPSTPAAGQDYYGARDYYLDGVHDGAFTRVAIEIYPSKTDPGTWTAYMDYLSPATRQLQ